eukprot:9935-Heterococcus_DN1.PRE.3
MACSLRQHYSAHCSGSQFIVASTVKANSTKHDAKHINFYLFCKAPWLAPDGQKQLESTPEQ